MALLSWSLCVSFISHSFRKTVVFLYIPGKRTTHLVRAKESEDGQDRKEVHCQSDDITVTDSREPFRINKSTENRHVKTAIGSLIASFKQQKTSKKIIHVPVFIYLFIYADSITVF